MGLRYEIEYSFFGGREVRRKSVSSPRVALARLREICAHSSIPVPAKLEATPMHRVEWKSYGGGYVTVTDTEYKA